MKLLDIRAGTEAALKCKIAPAPQQKGPWSSAEFLLWVNVFQDKLHAHIAALNEGAFETEQFLPEVAGTATISLPVNLYKLIKLERVAGGGASLTNPVEVFKIDRHLDDELSARNMGTVGLEFYRQSGQKFIKLEPPPTTTQSSGLRATYIAKPAPLINDTDVPLQITAGPGGSGLDDFSSWHDIILLSTIERLLQKNKELDKAQFYGQARDERLQELGAFLKPMNAQATRFVRYAGSAHDAVWS